MRRLVLSWLLCGMLVGSVAAQGIIVNEYLNRGNNPPSPEYVELLVLTDKLDVRGYQVRDFVASSGDVSGTITFANDALWASVRSGYIIVIELGTSTAEVSFADGVVTVGSSNTTYFSESSTPDIAGNRDGIEILNPSASHVHALVHGNGISAGSALATARDTSPSAYQSGTSSSNDVVRFINTDEVADFDNDTNTQHSGTITKGAPNDATQGAYRAKLLPIWINEVSTNQGTSDLAEFIEIAGPAGFALTGYRIRVYTCSAGVASLDYTETVGSYTFADDFSQFGYFVLGAPTVTNQDQDFTGNNFDRISDTGGIVVLIEPGGSTHELFDYKFGVGCPLDATDGRTTRSLPDDVTPPTTMGFITISKPSGTATGNSLLEASPGAPNENLLPVELTAFEAVADGESVMLRWETASETNNAGFEIQRREGRSAKGEEVWQALAFVDGHGTTEQAQTYAHRIDEVLPGVYRFRLKQIDYDGTFDYSPEVEVAIGVPGTYHLTAAYPNPFNPETSFSLSVARTQEVQVAVYDVVGRRVALLYEGSFPAATTRAFRFEADALPSGVYLLQVLGEQFVTTQPLVLTK